MVKSVIKKTIIVLLAAVLLASVLVLLSNAIPSKLTVENIKQSAFYFSDKKNYSPEQYSGRLIDNYSDAIMTSLSGISGGSFNQILDKAVNSYTLSSYDESPLAAINSYFLGDGSNSFLWDYSRYWHGYQIILRPLFVFFDIQQIYNINLCLQYALLAVAVVLMMKKQTRCVLPFIISVLFMAPSAMGKCFQYTSMFYVMIIDMILLLWNPKNIFSRNYYWLFLITGLTIVFLDLLSAPLVTLIMPLCLLIAIRQSEGASIKELFIMCVVSAVAWGIGYTVMWAAKWIIVEIYRGGGFLASVLWQANFQSAATSITGEISRFDAVMANIYMITDNYHLTVLTVVLAVVLFFDYLKNSTFKSLISNIIYIVPFLGVFVWMLAMAHHSYQHSFFTYRIVCAAVFCFLTALSHPLSLSVPEKDRKN